MVAASNITRVLADEMSPRPSLAGSVMGELIKIGRLRSVRAAIGMATLASGPALVYVAATARSGSGARGAAAFEATLLVLEAMFLAGAIPFLLALSATNVGMEYGHGTIRVLLARGAGRVRLLTAKLIALTLVGSGLLTIYLSIAAVVFGVAATVWRVSPSGLASAPWPDVPLALFAAEVGLVVAVVAGTAAGVVARSTAAALIVGFGFFALDSLLLPLITRGGSTKISLGFQLGYLTSGLRLSSLLRDWTDTVWAAVVVAAWLVVMLLLARRLLHGRDVVE
jgi:ABC-type transport system involved in multi-copper enzyme maturation permease subunit